MDEAQAEAIRSRIHKLADTVQGHDARLHEHAIMHSHTEKELESLRGEKASRHELHSHQTLMQQSMAAAANEVKLEISHMRDGQATLQRAVNWVVALVIGAVILAGLNLILHDGGAAHAEQPSIETPAHVR